MNKLTNYQTELIQKTYKTLHGKKRGRNHHLTVQVHTHIDLLQRTGKGAEVLEHYNRQNSNKNLHRVFYYEGKIYDFTDMEYDFYVLSKSRGWLHTKRRNIMPAMLK